MLAIHIQDAVVVVQNNNINICPRYMKTIHTTVLHYTVSVYILYVYTQTNHKFIDMHHLVMHPEWFKILILRCGYILNVEVGSEGTTEL